MSLADVAGVRAPTQEEQRALRVTTLAALRHMPYLAGVLYNMRLVVAPGLGRMGVDASWRLYADPVVLTEWPMETRVATLLHEAGHLLRRHARRAAAVGVGDRQRWNLATDLDLNDDLAGPGTPGLAVPDGWPRPATFGLPGGRSAEEYYALLAGSPGPPGEDGDGEGGGDGTTAGRGSAGEGPAGEADLDTPRGCGSGAGGDPLECELPDGDAPDGMEGLSEAEADLLAREAALRISEHLAARGRGTVPAGLRRWAEEELAPPTVDWRQELAAAVRRATSHAAGKVDYTYRRPSRRRIPGVVLPSTHQPRPQVVTVVDTSGSMSADQLGAALGELDGICRRAGLRGPDHRVMTVDAEAHGVRPVRGAADVVLTGGGGTNMARGIASALALRPRPDVLIVMTDGLTPWPTTRPARAKVVVVLIRGAGVAAPAPPEWAHVVEVDPDPG